MPDLIKLVSGDTRPEITLTLTDEVTGDPIDLSAASVEVFINFRAAGSTTLIEAIPADKTDAVNGIVTFDFSTGALYGLAAGAYEGEIEISYSGDTHTLYDVLKFRVRDGF